MVLVLVLVLALVVVVTVIPGRSRCCLTLWMGNDLSYFDVRRDAKEGMDSGGTAYF